MDEKKFIDYLSQDSIFDIMKAEEISKGSRYLQGFVGTQAAHDNLLEEKVEGQVLGGGKSRRYWDNCASLRNN